MSKARRKAAEFVLPPHENAETHRRMMESLSRMTPAELAQTVIDAGICMPDGELTEHYREPEVKKANGARRRRVA